jgi:hypothetical protein
MSDSINDNVESVITRFRDSRDKLESLLGENFVEKLFSSEKVPGEAWDHYLIWEQSIRDIRSRMRPTKVIPGVENEEIVDSWRRAGNYDSYPVLYYLKEAIKGYSTTRDHPPLDSYECSEMLTFLIDFRFFDPDQWLKKEDEFPPLYVSSDGIPKWLLNRYEEALYAYIYGFNNAAIALCRTIVEGIIDDKLGDKCNKTAKIQDKIEFFMKTVKDKNDQQVVWSTHKVRKLANIVLHKIKESCTENEVKDGVLATRDLIQVVY